MVFVHFSNSERHFHVTSENADKTVEAQTDYGRHPVLHHYVNDIFRSFRPMGPILVGRETHRPRLEGV